ncbi:MAG: hypothetical protein OXE59_02290 [Bacteroidetes bacterium]|nr:hypothetical protein [Bacteroidota bacterium]MCY4232560.1 hypothetical protein [Bacteroidota bacterium]
MIRYSLLILIAATRMVNEADAQASLSVTPAYVVTTDESPFGSFVLSNQGTEPVEVTITAHYGVIASTDSTTEVVLGEAGQLGDLSPFLSFFPHRCILTAGSEQTVRYRIHESHEGGHIALMHFAMRERGAIVDGQIPEVASGLSIVYTLVAPLIYLQGRGHPILTAYPIQLSGQELHLSLENHSQWPFFGGIRVIQKGQQLGRAEAAIYTKRLIRIPVSNHLVDSAIRLEFDTDYTGLKRMIRSQLGIPNPINLTGLDD